jgi:hypothetical protein
LNKLPTYVFSLLLLSGAALWYLANNSLDYYVKNQIETLGSELTQQSVKVGNVSILNFQGKGTITNLVIAAESGQTHNGVKLPILSIDAIEITFDPKSLKNEVIEIEKIVINNLTTSLEQATQRATIMEIHDKIALALGQNTIAKSAVMQNFRISEVIINTLQLNGSTKNNVQLEANAKTSSRVLTNLHIENIGDQQGLNANIIGVTFVKELFNILKQNLK